ncbi:Beta-galactosidase 8 [Datura stramonium]|uniref:beta-galactosidase n=1 Tax=Datura stramonium TaxID=4076 RepID=A0ABS8VKS4_DATST|nr:Beta-galactosidase 8 [Datura stramonium]
MKRFTAKIIDMIKQENLYASQGRSVILSQIENEYGNGDIESRYGPRAKPYINWATSMVTYLDTGVPWLTAKLSLSVIFTAFEQYHGGTNFGRTSGGSFIATSYDYDAPLDEYGMIPLDHS